MEVPRLAIGDSGAMKIFKEGGCAILILWLIISFCVVFLSLGLQAAIEGVRALEIRLQNVEHLLSLALSESRSPAFTNRVDGLRDDANAPQKRANP